MDARYWANRGRALIPRQSELSLRHGHYLKNRGHFNINVMCTFQVHRTEMVINSLLAIGRIPSPSFANRKRKEKERFRGPGSPAAGVILGSSFFFFQDAVIGSIPSRLPLSPKMVSFQYVCH